MNIRLAACRNYKIKYFKLSNTKSQKKSNINKTDAVVDNDQYGIDCCRTKKIYSSSSMFGAIYILVLNNKRC